MGKVIDREIRLAKKDGYWSPNLAQRFGALSALSFAFGAQLLHDDIMNDIEELEAKGEGATLRDVSCGIMEVYLPPKYMDRYDLPFLQKMLDALDHLVERAASGDVLIAHKPIEEILMRNIAIEADEFVSLMADEENPDEKWASWNEEFNARRDKDFWTEWPYYIFDDDDVEFFLYDSDCSWIEVKDYQFENWFTPTFYLDQRSEQDA